MDPMSAFDMERRTGISRDEVDDFAERMDLIAKAMEDIKNGTFDPVNCKIPGYKTPEQEEMERQEREKKEEERRVREEEKKRRTKQEEHDKWWYKAGLRHSLEQGSEDDQDDAIGTTKGAQWANRVLAAYKSRDANDYSVWDSWVPEDPVSRHERADREAELEKIRNREFEVNNPEFCNQFKHDLEERQRSQKQKEHSAQKLKQKGNVLYKRKNYTEAIENYMQALELAPFNVAVLANIAQCYLRLDEMDNCVEFCTRTLFIDPNHIKALSRRANVWHKQSKLKEAAEDMKMALALDPENPDVIEQHFIVVGDYEDSATKSILEAAIRGASAAKTKLGSNVVEELRFVQGILDQINKQECAVESTPPSLPEVSNHESCKTPNMGIILWQWSAYELLLPFVERSEYARDHLRTSGELFRLSDRLQNVLTSAFSAGHNPTTQVTKENVDYEIIISAMLNCLAAGVADTPRNQVVLFRQKLFRESLLASLSQLHPDIASSHNSKTLCDLLRSSIVQASIVRVIEEVIDSKAWKNAVLSSPTCLNRLFEILQHSKEGNNVPQRDADAITNRGISASSICFTLSNDAVGINILVKPEDAGQRICAISKSIRAFGSSDSPTLKNLLGLVTNLTTSEAFRAAIEVASLESERKSLIKSLLSIAEQFYTCPTSADYTSSERALAALLNLTFHEYSQVRREDLLEMNAADTLHNIFGHMQQKNFIQSICILSRASSLLCRLHVIRHIANKSKIIEECEKKLSDNTLLTKLLFVCKEAMENYKNDIKISGEIWQVCAQIWCHFGWCAHLTTVRSLLRQENALPLLLEAVALANQRNTYRKSESAATNKNGTSTERLVGNIVKVLIALESDYCEDDYTSLSTERSLKVLVYALQHLPDGLARKNVAILLAKLCQRDPTIKDVVRSLRGIEMMLSISQSLQKPSLDTGKQAHKALSA